MDWVINNGSSIHANRMGKGKAITMLHGLIGSPAIDAGIDLGLPFTGAAPDLGAFEVGLTTDVKDVNDSGSQPENFNLHQNYPNPFNPGTRIVYEIPTQSFVKMRVFDLLGREIIELVSEEKTAGSYVVKWDGRDSKGEEAASGIYLYTMKISNTQNGQSFIETKKMILLH